MGRALMAGCLAGIALFGLVAAQQDGWFHWPKIYPEPKIDASHRPLIWHDSDTPRGCSATDCWTAGVQWAK